MGAVMALVVFVSLFNTADHVGDRAHSEWHLVGTRQLPLWNRGGLLKEAGLLAAMIGSAV